MRDKADLDNNIMKTGLNDNDNDNDTIINDCGLYSNTREKQFLKFKLTHIRQRFKLIS